MYNIHITHHINTTQNTDNKKDRKTLLEKYVCLKKKLGKNFWEKFRGGTNAWYIYKNRGWGMPDGVPVGCLAGCKSYFIPIK